MPIIFSLLYGLECPERTFHFHFPFCKKQGKAIDRYCRVHVERCTFSLTIERLLIPGFQRYEDASLSKHDLHQ